MKKNSTLKTIRNIVISVVVMLVLFVGAGVAYVLITGQSDTKQAEEKPEASTQPPAIPKPQKPNPNAAVGAALESLLSPVKAGANTTMSVRTTPTAKCTIVVTYNNVPSKDSGLAPKLADDYGNVAWTWTVDASAPPGKWPAKVTCAYGARSGMVQGNLEVTK